MSCTGMPVDLSSETVDKNSKCLEVEAWNLEFDW